MATFCFLKINIEFETHPPVTDGDGNLEPIPSPFCAQSLDGDGSVSQDSSAPLTSPEPSFKGETGDSS